MQLGAAAAHGKRLPRLELDSADALPGSSGENRKGSEQKSDRQSRSGDGSGARGRVRVGSGNGGGDISDTSRGSSAGNHRGDRSERRHAGLGSRRRRLAASDRVRGSSAYSYKVDTIRKCVERSCGLAAPLSCSDMRGYLS